MAKGKGRGWHGDSARHSTAAKKGKSGGSSFSKSAIKKQLGRRSNTKANRAAATKELKSLVKYDKAKWARRSKAAKAPDKYAAAKKVSKARDRRVLKKAGLWAGK